MLDRIDGNGNAGGRPVVTGQALQCFCVGGGVSDENIVELLGEPQGFGEGERHDPLVTGAAQHSSQQSSIAQRFGRDTDRFTERVTAHDGRIGVKGTEVCHRERCGQACGGAVEDLKV